MSAISGGKFWSGFAAGALSSVASSSFSWDANGVKEAGLGWGSSVRSSDLGMIGFGTVSGGAGAALTGGNFWQGAVTGLVVSGLNHYVHKIVEDCQIYDRLKDAGIENPYAAASYKGLSLKEFGLKIFPDLMQQANNPELEKRETVDNNGSLGLTPIASNDLTGEHTFKGTILIARNAFSSYMQLASTIGHELNHAIDTLNGNMTAWFRKGGEEYRSAMSETNAYNWIISNGGYYDPIARMNSLQKSILYNKVFNNVK